jgi:hypothetical protein
VYLRATGLHNICINEDWPKDNDDDPDPLSRSSSAGAAIEEDGRGLVKLIPSSVAVVVAFYPRELHEGSRCFTSCHDEAKISDHDQLSTY